MICRCEICCEPFTTEHKRKYCEECREMIRETSAYSRRSNDMAKYVYKKEIEKSRAKMKGMTISEVVKAANEEGLTYGKYVAKHGL